MLGQTLSHYRITARIGAGGMGEVYRATDTRLGRDVALKMLPRELANDPDRLARFAREAKLLASLNHPSIAQLYAFEQVTLDAEASCVHLLVMELVEGLDLKQRLDGGPIPVDEALEIALHVAEALEEAHNKGIVHRDLKPANVKLTPDGKVKVLDFGLAKAWAGDGHGSGSSSSALSQSPTLAHTGTIAGVILGTAAYMSPEQARGKAVDKRADVWSFGVLLWEMLTGRAMFAGETVSDVVASVLKNEPDLNALPEATPPSVRKLIARCLRKDPRQRLPDIGAARLELQDAIEGGGEDSDPAGSLRLIAPNRRLARLLKIAAGALVVAVAIAGYLAVAPSRRSVAAQPAGNFVLDVPGDLTLLDFGAPAVSPDGRNVAFAASSANGRLSIWVRTLDSSTTRELPDSAGVVPVWSPDGTAIAFARPGELRRIDLATGLVRKICRLPPGNYMGADWVPDGRILFSAGGMMSARLYTVPAGGGEPKPLTTLDAAHGEYGHWWPKLLPDGRHFTFQVAARPERQGLHLASLDAPGERRRLLDNASQGFYCEGQLLFARDGTLLAQSVDADKAKLTGEPRAIASPVEQLRAGTFDWGFFSAGAGLLAYVEGTPAGTSELVSFDRAGHRLATVAKPGLIHQVRLSPDGRTALLDLGDGTSKTRDIWTLDVGRGVLTRQTFDGTAADPVWSPDGREIAFVSFRGGTSRIYRKAPDGTQPETPLRRAPEGVYLDSWTSDSKTLLCHFERDDRAIILAAHATEDADAEPIVESAYGLDEAQVSPDGRWLAYVSQETGSWGVYIAPFKRPGERVRVSPQYGGQPKWRADGRELYYVTTGGKLVVVQVKELASRLEISEPVQLFDGVDDDYGTDTFAPTPDGQRFLVIVPSRGAPTRRIRVITNWTSLLEKK